MSKCACSRKRRHFLRPALRAVRMLLAGAGVLIFAAGAHAESQPSSSPLSPNWGIGFMTCAGSTPGNPALFKVANPWSTAEILASGIVKCVDDGDAFLYTVDYINFALSSGTDWPSAHLEWLGAGVQKSAPLSGRARTELEEAMIRARMRIAPEWLYDEVRPIKVLINRGVKRVAISGLSFRIPKSILAQASGFGFYVVGGGAMWSLVFI